MRLSSITEAHLLGDELRKHATVPGMGLALCALVSSYIMHLLQGLLGTAAPCGAGLLASVLIEISGH